MDPVLVSKVILTMIGVISSVYGVSYIVIGRFDIPFISRKESTVLGSVLVAVALALFIVSFAIP
ncbi:hypothetical protein GWK48_00875 [Metallosphaera tengchongensis]|uniref:Uncharacterized protein n=1 Tax=Metallosphaera tengchongensis TaxID=1532350 RepID=A0A6N0NVF6_9CREN|nr:hypothetical protein [Metallosphaera tengchongensis]QKQ99139.1 hypothetical protein GWK48_00875 [Metallosphaera tengchongensis]